MFIAEFKRRYEKELLKNPDLHRFIVSTEDDKNKIVNQRDHIRSSNYRAAKGKTKRNNNFVTTSSRKETSWNGELRELLGGTVNTNAVTTRKGIITGNDSTKMKAAKYQRTIKDRKVPVDNPKNTFSNLSETIENRKKWANTPDFWNDDTFFKPHTSTGLKNNDGKQPLALPSSSRPKIATPTITSTQNTKQNMPPLNRTKPTIKSAPHVPIKPAGMNKYLAGGVVAGIGLAGVGAYSLYQNNRDKNKNKQ